MDINVFNLDKPINKIYNFQKEQYVKINPSADSITCLNQAGNIVFSSTVLSDALYIPNSFIMAEFNLMDSTNTKLLGAENVTLENNFFPRCFSQMEMQIGSSTIEVLDEPGESETLLKLVRYDKTYAKTYGQMEGWIIDTGDGKLTKAEPLTEANYLAINKGYAVRKNIYNNKHKQYTIIWRLFPLFAMAENYSVLKAVSFKLILKRKINNEEIFYGKGGVAKLRFNKMEWYLPLYTPSLENEKKLNKILISNDEIKFPLLKRTLFTTSINSAIHDWEIASISNNPRFILVGFKDATAPSYGKNDHRYIGKIKDKYIKSIRLDLNTTKYPNDEFLEINATNNSFSEFYNYYSICVEIYLVYPHNLIQLIKLFHIFFDFTSQPEDIKEAGIRVTLRIRLSDAMNLTAYALVLEDSIQVINIPRNSTMRIE